MNAKVTLALAALVGLAGAGCADDPWYEDWYAETPTLGEADPNYAGGIDLQQTLVADTGCIVDGDFAYWWVEAYFPGVAASGSATIIYEEPGEGEGETVVTSYAPYYTETGGGIFDASPFAGDEVDYFDYIYAEFEMPASTCSDTNAAPEGSEVIFFLQATDQVDGSMSCVAVSATDGSLVEEYNFICG